MQVSLGLLSSRVAYAKSGKGWTTLSLGDVTAHGRFRFHLVERILYPGYPGGGDVIQQSFTRGGSAPGSSRLPFYIQLAENVSLSRIPLSHT